jgi:hypothetical protein
MNGRIKLVDAPNAMMLQDRNRTTISTYHEALTGNWESSPLSKAYFSTQNQQILQNGIRAGVHRMSGGKFVIAQQPDTELKMVMRSIYLQHSTNEPGNVSAQIQRLNNAVLNFVVPKVYGEAKGYQQYLHDVSNLVVPMARPVNGAARDKTLEMKPFF